MEFANFVKPMVKEIERGSQYRKIVMQTQGNKTITKVLDYNGKELINREKTITCEKAGNNIIRSKNVKTLKNSFNMNGCDDILSIGSICNHQRVYNGNGKLLGGRITEQEERFLNHGKLETNPLDLIKDGWRNVIKYIGKFSDSGRFTKTTFDNGIRFRKKFTKGYIDIFDFKNTLMFNNRGLPIPATFHNSGMAWRSSIGSNHKIAYERAWEKSLKDMVQMAKEDSAKIRETAENPWEETYGDPELADKIFYRSQHFNIS